MLEISGDSFDVVNAYYEINGKFDITNLYGHSAINDKRGRNREMPTNGQSIDHVFCLIPKSKYM